MEERDLLLIQKELNSESIPLFIGRLSGGDINEVFQVEIQGEHYVVKKNRKEEFPEMLEKEFRALKYVNIIIPDLYPKPIKAFSSIQHQFLVIEYHEKGSNTEKGQFHLSDSLATHHKHTSDKFGWEEDNYIGSLQQSNDLRISWEDFYAENRLLAQTKLAFDKGHMTKQTVSQMETFCKELASIFPKESPALLHGDLWGGNYFITSEEKPLLYDPAMYFGHREIDIAMTRLFGGFSQVFYDHYCEVYPLEKGWDERIPYGQLYPNLVHLNLFGPAYLSAVTSVINRF